MYQISRAGASQIVTVPWNDEDLATALGVILRQFGRVPRVGRLIAVAAVPERDSAAFAVNLAAEVAARWGIECILAEPTARLARLTAYLEVTPQTGAYDLLAGAERLTLSAVQQALTPAGDRFRLLPGPLQGIALQAPDPARLDRLVGLLRQLAGCVVLHVPNTFDPAQFAALAMAEHVVLLGGQQVPAIHSLKLLRESLLAHRTAGTQYVVLQRYDPHQGGADPKRLRELLQVNEVWTIADDASAWMAAVNAGVPLRVQAPRSPALTDLDRLLVRLLGPPPG
jgi:Flp pilus assembly CpaE family ATPase